jgi:Uma2 family endonuclease
MSAQPEQYITFESYLDIEKRTGIKHEYYRGRVYAMTGASTRHNLIVANILASLL